MSTWFRRKEISKSRKWAIDLEETKYANQGNEHLIENKNKQIEEMSIWFRRNESTFVGIFLFSFLGTQKENSLLTIIENHFSQNLIFKLVNQ